jgi:UDP-glucose 4-epimerase
MTSILVTGGAGYIGSHTCKALRRAGFDPIAYDNLERGNPEAVKWGPLELGELADKIRLCEAFARFRPGAVIHFAALAYVGESNANPAVYYQNNVGGTATLLAAMRECGIDNIVFSSSCAVYGTPASVPAEACAMAPINPYGATKMICERMLRECAAAIVHLDANLFPPKLGNLAVFRRHASPNQPAADRSLSDQHESGLSGSWRHRHGGVRTVRAQPAAACMTPR